MISSICAFIVKQRGWNLASRAKIVTLVRKGWFPPIVHAGGVLGLSVYSPLVIAGSMGSLYTLTINPHIRDLW